MIETAIRQILLTDPVIAGLVGSRVYTGVMPQDPTLPAITLMKVDKLSDVILDGTVGPNTLRVQVDCWARDGSGTAGADNVRALAAAVNGSDDQGQRGALHGYCGTVAGEAIRLLELLVERSTDYEPETQLYRVSADYAAHL